MIALTPHFGSPLDGERLCQRHEPGFGRAVSRSARRGANRRHGCDVDDRAARLESASAHFAATDRWSGASRFRRSIDSWNLGEASAASTSGLPPALLTTTSRRPNADTMSATRLEHASTSRTSAAMKVAALPAADDILRFGSSADDDQSLHLQEGLRDAAADSPGPSGDAHDGTAEVERC